jgi:hypothetical protein
MNWCVIVTEPPEHRETYSGPEVVGPLTEDQAVKVATMIRQTMLDHGLFLHCEAAPLRSVVEYLALEAADG